MKHRSAALILAVSLASLASADGPANKDPDTIVRGLLAPTNPQRDAAEEAIVALGPDALPALQRLRDTTRDVDARDRIPVLVRRIEHDEKARGVRVTIDRETPMLDAIERLAESAKLKFEPSPELQSALASIKTGEAVNVSWLEARDRLAARSGMRLEDDGGRLVARAGVEATRPRAYVGVARLTPRSAVRSFGLYTGRVQPSGPTQLTIDLATEPGLEIVAAQTQLQIDSAMPVSITLSPVDKTFTLPVWPEGEKAAVELSGKLTLGRANEFVDGELGPESVGQTLIETHDQMLAVERTAAPGNSTHAWTVFSTTDAMRKNRSVTMAEARQLAAGFTAVTADGQTLDVRPVTAGVPASTLGVVLTVAALAPDTPVTLRWHLPKQVDLIVRPFKFDALPLP